MTLLSVTSDYAPVSEADGDSRNLETQHHGVRKT